MQTVTIQQFMKELLKLSDLNQSQMAKQIGFTQGSLSNSIKTGNPNLKILKAIAKYFYLERQECFQLLIEDCSFNMNSFEYRDIVEWSCHPSNKELAERMQILPSTLRSRLSRNSCTVKQFKEHLQALGFETILL